MTNFKASEFYTSAFHEICALTVSWDQLKILSLIYRIQFEKNVGCKTTNKQTIFMLPSLNLQYRAHFFDSCNMIKHRENMFHCDLFGQFVLGWKFNTECTQHVVSWWYDHMPKFCMPLSKSKGILPDSNSWWKYNFDIEVKGQGHKCTRHILPWWYTRVPNKVWLC